VIHVSRELSAMYLPWRKQLFVYGAFLRTDRGDGGTRAVFAAAAAAQPRSRRGGAAESGPPAAAFFQPAFSSAWRSPRPKTKHWLQFNDLLCEMLGYAREELATKTWAELTHPDDLDKDLAEFERVLRGESEGYMLDKRFIRKDGAAVFTTINIKCTRNSDGTVAYIVAMVQDISERKRKEEEYRSIIQASTDGFWITDTAGRILDANDSICRMLDIPGRNCCAWPSAISTRTSRPRRWTRAPAR